MVGLLSFSIHSVKKWLCQIESQHVFQLCAICGGCPLWSKTSGAAQNSPKRRDANALFAQLSQFTSMLRLLVLLVFLILLIFFVFFVLSSTSTFFVGICFLFLTVVILVRGEGFP